MMLNGRDTLYVSFATFSADASAPSILTAFTVSFREPSEMYPIAFSSPATVVIITDVLFVMLASSVVISTFSSPCFSSIPNSSMKAPLVPDPSSRDITSMVPLAALAVAANAVVPISAAVTIAKTFFFIMINLLFILLYLIFVFLIDNCNYMGEK